MTPGTIFISHRAEYGRLVRELKKAIEQTSRGKIEVFISEDIPRGEMWRTSIEDHLQKSESLFLLYGAPYEDWSWCFYEAGYFAALDPNQKTSRRIYCIARPDVPAPGPLSDLQLVTNCDQLIEELIQIYSRNSVNFHPAELRVKIIEMTKGLFGKLAEYVGHPRVYFTSSDTDLRSDTALPANAMLSSDKTTMADLFGIAKESITWADLTAAAAKLSAQEQVFLRKWIEETSAIILAAHENRVQASQTILIGRGGRRFRFILYGGRLQGDGIFCCEFLAIDEVGGPTLGLSTQLLSLLTGIRMGFRFRYEFIKQFQSDFCRLSENERQTCIKEIPRIIYNLTTESETRGNFNLQDLLDAFDEFESDRISKIVKAWPIVKAELYKSLGLSADGILVSEQGLRGDNIERYRIAFEAARLMNAEFLSRCCGRVARMMTKSEDELKKNAEALENAVNMLTNVDMKSAA
jgi:hypothetical protein